jgi:hypothetical protein
MDNQGSEGVFKYFPEMTDRGGRERGLDSYECYLGFKREDLEGKV